MQACSTIIQNVILIAKRGVDRKIRNKFRKVRRGKGSHEINYEKVARIRKYNESACGHWYDSANHASPWLRTSCFLPKYNN